MRWMVKLGRISLKYINNPVNFLITCENRCKLLTLAALNTIALSTLYLQEKHENTLEKMNLVNTVMAATDTKIDDKRKKSKMYNFIADAVEFVAPAVVYIEVIANVRNQYQNIQTTVSSGSGFIVTAEGMVLTNAHVISNSAAVEVRLSNGDTYKGVVIDVDDESDLAAVKLISNNKKLFPHVKLGTSSRVRAGEWVAALGSPLRLSNTVTAGIVSSLHRASGDIGIRRNDNVYIQTDAPINIGNSGGPLINLDGEVIGINCITVQQAAGISFAIPSDVAAEFLEGAMSKEKHTKQKGDVSSERGKRDQKFYIGISMLTLTPPIVRELQQRNAEYFADINDGVLVARVNIGSPSERGGLMARDVIISINKKPVKTSTDVYKEVRKGETMVINVKRNGNTLTLNVEPEITSRL
ncbi:serine protease HTRA2, mitochondrial-like isoform X2 [Hydractinia symbiolongicarpus]|nr:serine protease HTRA2, mitochondrial-like isoform X2 [Hydractinia symbiolongicarpus]